MTLIKASSYLILQVPGPGYFVFNIVRTVLIALKSEKKGGGITEEWKERWRNHWKVRQTEKKSRPWKARRSVAGKKKKHKYKIKENLKKKSNCDRYN